MISQYEVEATIGGVAVKYETKQLMDLNPGLVDPGATCFKDTGASQKYVAMKPKEALEVQTGIAFRCS